MKPIYLLFMFAFAMHSLARSLSGDELIEDPACSERQSRFLQPDSIDVPPEFFISVSSADYPPQALRNGIESKVRLRLHLSETGSILCITALRPDPGYGFVPAAIRIIRRAKISPAKKLGRPVKVIWVMNYNFILK